ncbi:MAG: hypothetical protein IJU05_07595 [Schwartzia sp.]|nr:hypothetical protein [Schwartzia sp. (in: firmicutes)]
MMNVNINSPASVRLAGMQAIAGALGPVGFARFFQQFEEGYGDYTKEKYQREDIPLDALDMLLTGQE